MPAGRRPTRLGVGDLAVLVAIFALITIGVHLATGSPRRIIGPSIDLSPAALPYYALFSLGRMAAAYALSLAFSIVYGSVAASHRTAEAVLLPLIDVLQSVPILSFLPVVVLSLTALLPERIGIELGAIVLVFTSQVWNLTFSYYQSLTTIPGEFKEAARIFHYRGWLRFLNLDLPFAAIPLLWNSILSWAGGWFFLMAAETFTVGGRDFRLPGLGSYLQAAADAGDTRAILWGVLVLVGTIVALDQLVWRPLLAWADRFKLETTEADEAPSSWVRDLVASSAIVARLHHAVGASVDRLAVLPPARVILPREESLAPAQTSNARRWPRVGVWLGWGAGALVAITVLGMILAQAVVLLATLPPSAWGEIAVAALATAVRVALALVIALAWTVPCGIALGLRPHLSAAVQPVLQIIASVPATALFPVILLAFLKLPGGLDVAAVFLMLLGTQWYILFNVIAGASAIPSPLRQITATLHIRGWERWRALYVPAIFPALVTGMITASGGSWNASIVAEEVKFGGERYGTIGLGGTIARATAAGDYALLLAATLTMITLVVLINRLVWRRLYAVAAERYRLD